MKKKLLLLVAVFCFLGISLQAQETMNKGRLVGSARVGFSNSGVPVAVAVAPDFAAAPAGLVPAAVAVLLNQYFQYWFNCINKTPS
mgnify:CR=1 FL=1